MLIITWWTVHSGFKGFFQLLGPCEVGVLEECDEDKNGRHECSVGLV